jgi:Copper type II ascorbate-dependent monooxygenase, C-terminal domain
MQSRVLIARNAALLRLSIPPEDPDFKAEAILTIPYDCDFVNMTPHAHLRGRSFECRILRPDGTSETVLRAGYDFHWQFTYYLQNPIHLTKGTRIQVIAHYDNSPNNPNNPDPTQRVHWGERSTDEMLMGYFSVEVDANGIPWDRQ